MSRLKLCDCFLAVDSGWHVAEWRREHPHSADWDVAVLHFLGVDHVGHLDGPSGPRMARKLAELDRVLVSLVANIKAQDALRGNGSCTVIAFVRYVSFVARP